MVYFVFIVPFFFAAVHAANDWSKPCFQGVCSYDLPPSAGSASGTMKIWGSQDAISDITTAAGWMILGCAPDALAQDIRLVCKSDDTNAAGCDHLYQNIGAEGKIVRLPENCGKSAFARVSKAWIPTDQSIPASIATRFARRDGLPPQVKALSLDTNFGAIDVSKAGKVNIAIRGGTVPGLNSDIVLPSTSQRRSRLASREPFDLIGDIQNGLSSIGDAGKAVVNGAGDVVGDVVDGVLNANDFDFDKKKSLPPINVNTKFNLLNNTVSCPPLEASIKIDISTKAKVTINLGVAASGTIIPPNIDDFGVAADFSADLEGALDFIADVSGTLDSGKIKIFEVGIPGLDFPGVLAIGPTFEINAQAKATLDLNVDLKVGVNYNVKKARVVFPPKDKQRDGSFQIGDTPLKLSASPSVTATGTVEAHLIPSLNLGISALDDKVEAKVFMDLDASAVLQLKLQANAEASITVDKNQTKSDPPAAKALPSVTANKRSHYRRFATSHRTTDIHDRRHAIIASRAATTNTSASFGGCVDLKAGFDVNAGADGDFFGLFNAKTKVNLFTKKFELFKKCFGDGVTRRSVAPRTSLERRKLSCTKPDIGSAVPVADLALNGVNIKVVE